MNFSELGLSDQLIAAIARKGFEEPTAIQAVTIPVMLSQQQNIVAQAQTGTGKTAAFGLPLIQLLDTRARATQALILVPTRELAIQVAEELNSLRSDTSLVVTPIYGGQSIGQQLRRLKKGVHVVVGTPGRVIDHLNRKTLDLSAIDYLVLDEADEMMNMGFLEDMEEIIEHTNPEKRMLLFSATIPKRIRSLAKRYMRGYELLTVEEEAVTSKLTEQIYFEVRQADKFEALCRIVDIEDGFYGLVFCRTKSDVDGLTRHLLDRGYDAEAIHGDITQTQRERTLEKFKKKQVNILVATDVAARGIDVYNLSHVINYSLPHNPDSYVHRIGRTGRAGNEGTAITFITPSEYKRLMFIQRMAKTDIKKSDLPTVKEIIKAKKRKIYQDLTKLLEDDVDDKYYKWAKKLLTENHPTRIMAALLNYCFEDLINPDVYREIEAPLPRGRQVDQRGKARLFVALGKRDDMTPRKLVELITKRCEIKGRDISDIDVTERFSIVTVPFRQAETVVASFKEKGRQPLVRHDKKEKRKKSASRKRQKKK